MNKGILLISLFALGINMAVNGADAGEQTNFNAVQEIAKSALIQVKSLESVPRGAGKAIGISVTANVLNAASEQLLKAGLEIKDQQLRKQIIALINEVDAAKLSLIGMND